MNTVRRISATILSVILFSGLALAVPVSAHAEKGSDSSASNTSSGKHAEKENEAEPEANDVNHEANEDVNDDHGNDAKTTNLRDQFKALAQQDVANKKAQVKQQSQEDRQKVCSNRKTNLTKRMANAVKDAQAHKTHFDNVYVKVKAFQASKNLSVSNYDGLVATADAAGIDAAASISALQSLDVSVDCTSATVADSVSAFQQAVKATRDSLKTYRTDIIAVISALKAASTDGGRQ